MTEEQILDRAVAIIEQYSHPFPAEIQEELKVLTEEVHNLSEDNKTCYELVFWHKGYEIHFYGRKFFYAKRDQEEYRDMVKRMTGEMTDEEYKAKYPKWAQEVQRRMDKLKGVESI